MSGDYGIDDVQRQENVAAPGAHVSIKKPDRFEIDQRIELLISMIAEGRSDTFVKAVAKQQWGVVDSTAERYIRTAKQKLIEATGRSREEMRAELWAYFNSLRTNLSKLYRSAETVKEKTSVVREQRSVADSMIALYGLNAPRSIHVHATKSDTLEYLDVVVSTLTVEQLEIIDSVAALAEQAEEQHLEKLRREAESEIFEIQASSVSVHDAE